MKVPTAYAGLSCDCSIQATQNLFLSSDELMAQYGCWSASHYSYIPSFRDEREGGQQVAYHIGNLASFKILKWVLNTYSSTVTDFPGVNHLPLMSISVSWRLWMPQSPLLFIQWSSQVLLNHHWSLQVSPHILHTYQGHTGSSLTLHESKSTFVKLFRSRCLDKSWEVPKLGFHLLPRHSPGRRAESLLLDAPDPSRALLSLSEEFGQQWMENESLSQEFSKTKSFISLGFFS